jgi:hypothetical protein
MANTRMGPMANRGINMECMKVLHEGPKSPPSLIALGSSDNGPGMNAPIPHEVSFGSLTSSLGRQFSSAWLFKRQNVTGRFGNGQFQTSEGFEDGEGLWSTFKLGIGPRRNFTVETRSVTFYG